ncbi:MAG: glycosyltransferase family 9 protein [bacterium]
MNKIVVINLGFIGDVINSSPVTISLKKQYPQAKLTYITIPASSGTANHLPGVDNVFVYDKKGKHKGLVNLLKIAFSYGEKPDLAIILNESLRSALLSFLIGAKQRIGRNSDSRGLLLTDKFPHLEEEIKMQIHVSEHYMRVLKPLGLYNSEYDFGFNYSDEDELFISKTLNELNTDNQKLIGICPCARHADKHWNEDETKKLIQYINKYTEYKAVIVGDKVGRNFAQKIRESGETDFIDFTTKTSIPQLAALISKFKMFITADTGPSHLSYVLKIPTVTLFYYPVMVKWGPKNANDNRTIYNENWKLITVEQVIEQMEDLAEHHKIPLKTKNPTL